ncbi:hexose transporter Hxt17p [Trichomonascus vanleenenianus]|uniref:sugar porter family MFS transporter n=1 Tax=Trichomonascus vanleenenianus TaxID=2268995 RepID=UPI003ECA53C8
MGHQWKLYMYGIAPTLGGYAFGYDTGSISGILTMDQFNEYFNHPSNGLQGGITSSIQAGAFVGSLLTGLFIADQLGRRWTLIIGASVFTIGIATTCGSNNIYALIAGRVINGLGLGTAAMGVPLFQSEISPPQIRGRIISLQQCVINFGILSSFLIQYGCSYINSNASWRLPLGLQLIPTTLLAIVMIFMPESPRWLVSKGHPEKALEVLARVHANGDVTDSFVIAEYEEIKATLEIERQMKKPSYFEILFSKEHGRRTILAMSVQFFQQAVGINSIMYYAPFLFQQAGVGSTEASLLSNVIQGVILNVVTWPNMYYLDTWGRRRPLILGAISMGVCMLLIGVIMKTVGHPHTNPDTNKVQFDFSNNLAAGRAVIAFLYLYVAAFAISWATPAWVVPAEILTMSARARANSLSTATNWFVNFWFAMYIPTALERISWRLYIMFAGISFLAAIVCFLFQPETANRSLEQMSFMFEPDKSVWVFTDRDLTDVHPRFATLEQRAQKYEQQKEAIEQMENPQV